MLGASYRCVPAPVMSATVTCSAIFDILLPDRKGDQGEIVIEGYVDSACFLPVPAGGDVLISPTHAPWQTHRFINYGGAQVEEKRFTATRSEYGAVRGVIDGVSTCNYSGIAEVDRASNFFRKLAKKFLDKGLPER